MVLVSPALAHSLSAVCRYTYVQLTALYPAFIFAARPGARAEFGGVLDLIWADTAANTFPAAGTLSGPHSRDYDTLLGHGMLFFEMYIWQLAGMTLMQCEIDDPHCEGPPAASNFSTGVAAGTGEPMTVIAISWFNMLHPAGYRPPMQLRALASTPATRVVQNRFIRQNVTANGQENRFAETYNYVTPSFAIGAASQEYITDTHSKYYPNIESKLLTVVLGGRNTINTPSAIAAQEEDTNCSDATQWLNGTDSADLPLRPQPVPASNPRACCLQCHAFPGGKCHYFSFVKDTKECYLKATADRVSAGHPNVIFGSCKAAPKATKRKSPEITLVADFRWPVANPYNAGPTIHNHGASNAHLALHIGAVQHREALLVTSALDVNDALQFSITPAGNLFTSLTTNFVLPADADEWMVTDARGQVVTSPVRSPTTGQLALGALRLDVLSTVCLRKAGGALCVKVFELDGVAGSPRSFSLVADSLGHTLNAVRLTGSHYRSPDGHPHWINGSTHNRSQPSATHARFAALLLAGTADNSSDLAALCHRTSSSLVRSKVAMGIWTATVNTTVQASTGAAALITDGAHSKLMAPVQLSVGRNLECSLASGLRYNQSIHTSWNCLTSRKIDGHEIVAKPFSVNGKNLSELLSH